VTARRFLELAHHHPGRIRVRSDALRSRDAHDAASTKRRRIEEALEKRHGVLSVRSNAGSGSVLVEYEPGVMEPDALVAEIAHAADLEPPPPESDRKRRAPRRSAAVMIGAARRMNAFVDDLTGGRADLRDLVPIAMLALAAYSSVVRKDPLPRWDNLTYWAFSLFQSLHQRDRDDDEGARR
jgi:hypothetical protein